MSLNDVRAPTVSVEANGVAIGGVVEVEISNNNFMSADRYKITAALNATGYNVWSANSIDVSITLGFGDSARTLIVGPVDRVEVDKANELIHVDGRDYTARFIAARTQETFENHSASEVVALIAARRGLSANVDLTTAFIGRNFGGSSSRITLNQFSQTTTEWDLLVEIADAEGFDLWVSGTTLNFTPPSLGTNTLVISPTQCVGLRLERELAFGRVSQVIVRSWDCRSETALTETAGVSDTDDSQPKYILVRPNLTSAAASSLAERTLAQMSQNTKVITLDIPGEIDIQPRQTLTLKDTDTDFDGTYVVSSVDRRLSYENGFTETIQARTPPWTVF